MNTNQSAGFFKALKGWLRRGGLLRSGFPRSLIMRMLLLVLGTVLLVQATTLVSFERYRQNFTETFTVDVIATTIRTLRASLVEIPPAERAEFVRNASRREWYLLSSLPPRTVSDHYDFHLLQDGGGWKNSNAARGVPRELWEFVRSINARLNKDARVLLANEPVPKLFISLSLELRPYDHSHVDAALRDATLPVQEWLVIPLNDLTPPAATSFIAGELTVMLLALVVAGFFAWHITRPLTHLIRAADRLASGQPHRVIPSGPDETRRLGQHFNGMLDALEESSAVRRTMLAGLPHDLKGPLARMWLRLEMMEDSPLKDGLMFDAKDMQGMVNQFTGFVRGTDPGSYQFVQMNLNEWLAEQLCAWESTGDSVRYADRSTQDVTLHADQGALARLLDNLITNAMKHGAPPVNVTLAIEGNHAVLTVSDHGQGIDPQRHEEALRPFSRLDSARTKTGSVGLGLALCEAIAKAHQGRLELGTAPSGGLEVAVWLPVVAHT